eukprot:CAMPEP_0178465592 /NCGR_PEP_ID=MMETSP0689_2-20121128/51439_1 /TAXON_ID=160604 /ORGANISM="Amphidinium massartii, Strain CS-259" /LENGTH=44 /DNA_ID= /DNA_START= /DNA_END= /DNA_ORIENTATION=
MAASPIGIGQRASGCTTSMASSVFGSTAGSKVATSERGRDLPLA